MAWTYRPTYENRMGRDAVDDRACRVRQRRLIADDDRAFYLPQGALTIERLAAPEHLIDCFFRLRNFNGTSPGRDGFRYSDLSPREACRICRELSNLVASGGFHPQRPLRVRVPKSSGIGFRTLSLRGILDRVLAKRAADLIERYFEPQFSVNSYGFRPRRGRENLLVTLRQKVMSENRSHLLVTDVQNAFDHVPITLILEQIARFTQNRDFLASVESMLRGGTRRRRGIDQGSPLSPLALNILLNVTLDSPFSQQYGQSATLLRFADNLIIPVQSHSQAAEALQCLQDQLRVIGMTLKPSATSIVDIYSNTIEILGCTVGTAAGDMTFAISPTAWTDLRGELSKARTAERPVERAKDIARGWLQAQGAAYLHEDRPSVIDRVMETIRDTGHWECSPLAHQLEQAWKQGFRHWQRILMEPRMPPAFVATHTDMRQQVMERTPEETPEVAPF